MMDPMAESHELLPLLDRASDRLLATVDGLADAAFTEPSGLPGWSRAHVVAHLALNGEALAAALAAVAVGQEVPMYRSQEARDEDIAELAGHEPTQVRTRLRTAVRGYAGALSLLADGAGTTVIHRTPGSSRRFTADETVAMRLAETEIHHADLAAGYSRDDWDDAFARHLVTRLAGQQAVACVLRATDTGDEWTIAGGEGPVVSGSVADLGWWLTGRGGQERLTVSSGPMPTIGKW